MLVGAIAISKNEIRERDVRVGRQEGRGRRKEESEREEGESELLTRPGCT